MNSKKTGLPNNDPSAEERKQDHIQLAFESQIEGAMLDPRFYYEPLLAAHPDSGSWPTFTFMGKTMRTPIWVSSMTGGTAKAHNINHNLAKACREFGMGMGLGSCRPLLYSDERLSDFNIRDEIGEEQLLFANLGIAQLEELLHIKEIDRVSDMITKLRADGLIIHVNPMQEWLQPEGDRFRMTPLETIRQVLGLLSPLPIIVKEVGQGIGPESLRQLMQLPLAAIDFAAAGGTSFSKLELLRDTPIQQKTYEGLTKIGHSAVDMVDWVNQLSNELKTKQACQQFIISGGIQNFLDGYFLINRLEQSAVYGQASAFLRYAQGDYEPLQTFVVSQIRGLELAKAFLKNRE